MTPSLAVRDAAAAIEFYGRVFGAEELPSSRLTDPNGNIVFVELRIGDAIVILAEEGGPHSVSPATLGGSPVRLILYVDDVDETARRAAAAGATIVIPVGDQFYGDRSGRLRDPFGHLWIISTRRADLSREEIQRRASALFGGPPATGQ